MWPQEVSLRFPLSENELAELVAAALREDCAHNDITTIATVPKSRHVHGRIVARQAGVICGVAFAKAAFHQLDPALAVHVDVEDGTAVVQGDSIVTISGHARGILSAERVALNFMQHLSGVASLTKRYVDGVSGTKVQILDTRKTTPGYRKLEKYAVRCGGGRNHRNDLGAAVLIKDNHLAAMHGDVGQAVSKARELAPNGTVIEVECDNLEQVRAAVAAKADVILLDNMTVAQLSECVRLASGHAKLEASGGVSLETVRAIAETGVDYISVGALTHSAPALNVALDFD